MQTGCVERGDRSVSWAGACLRVGRECPQHPPRDPWVWVTGCLFTVTRALAPLRFSLVSLCGVCLFWGPERREQLVLFKGLCNQQGKDQITIAEIFIIAEAGPPAV